MDNQTATVETVVSTPAAEPQKKTSKLGLVGLIVSIVSLGCCLFLNPLAPDFAIAGIILSVIGKSKSKEDPKSTIGIILSLISLFLCFLLFVVWIALIVAIYIWLCNLTVSMFQ